MKLHFAPIRELLGLLDHSSVITQTSPLKETVLRDAIKLLFATYWP